MRTFTVVPALLVVAALAVGCDQSTPASPNVDALGPLLDFEQPPQSDTDGDGVLDGDDVCPGTGIPESVPTERLGINRWALGVDGDNSFDTNLAEGLRGPRRSYTTEDTGGCSCEQIIDELELGQGHVKFGCSISAMDDFVALVND